MRHQLCRAVFFLVAAACVGACGIDENAPGTDDGGGGNGGGDGDGEGEEGGGGSGSDSTNDPVAACEALEDELASCNAMLDGALACGNYESTMCDLEPYFDCLIDGYGSCENGTFPNADPAALQDCIMLTTC